jgi:hypothetical protein
MATFTIKTTITGTVGGRSIDVSNTHTVADVLHVVEEASEMPLSQGEVTPQYVTLNNSANTVRRGLNLYSGPSAYAVVVGNQGGSAQIAHKFGVSDSVNTLHLGGVPTVFHYSDQFQGQVGGDAGPAIADPDGNLNAISVFPTTSILFRAFALYKPVS